MKTCKMSNIGLIEILLQRPQIMIQIKQHSGKGIYVLNCTTDSLAYLSSLYYADNKRQLFSADTINIVDGIMAESDKCLIYIKEHGENVAILSV